MVTNKHLTLNEESLKMIMVYSHRLSATQSRIIEGLIMKLPVIEKGLREENPDVRDRTIWDQMRKQICVGSTPAPGNSVYDQMKREGYYNR